MAVSAATNARAGDATGPPPLATRPPAGLADPDTATVLLRMMIRATGCPLTLTPPPRSLELTPCLWAGREGRGRFTGEGVLRRRREAHHAQHPSI